MDCRIVGALAFPDHHRYRPDEIMSLVEEASAKDAVPVTTEKDYVRLPAEARPMVEVLRVAVTWAEPAALDALLDPLMARNV
jgi:tetraacyldisaccharide 4'-kinase